jgi:hypothetical protein
MTEVTQNTEGAPEGTQGGTEGQPAVEIKARPEHIPEKFWDADKGEVRVEDLAKSYVELERGKKPDEGTPPPGDGDSGTTQGDPPPNPYAAALARAEAELAEGAALSEETYAAFESTGVSRDQVDLHIEGQKAIFELRLMKCQGEVGGAEAYQGMLDWAAANYTAEEAEQFNNTVFTASDAERKQAVAALKQRYEAQMGTDGKIVTDGTAPAATGGYTTRTEWMSDIQKPEYKKDPSFREQVQKKLNAALQAGVNMGVGVSFTGR